MSANPHHPAFPAGPMNEVAVSAGGMGYLLAAPFAVPLPHCSPSPLFPVTSHRSGRTHLQHAAHGQDHASGHARLAACGLRPARPYSRISRSSGKRTKLPTPPNFAFEPPAQQARGVMIDCIRGAQSMESVRDQSLTFLSFSPELGPSRTPDKEFRSLTAGLTVAAGQRR